VVRNAAGEVETVHYETLNVLLLNEVQKQERLNAEQQRRIAEQQQRIDALEERLELLEK
jgi:ribosome assembly protein YihI (activator of Der GTPase)